MRCARIRDQGFTRMPDGYFRRPYARVAGKLDKKRVRSESDSDSCTNAVPAKTVKRISIVSVPRRARHSLHAHATYLLPHRLNLPMERSVAKRKSHMWSSRNSCGYRAVSGSPKKSGVRSSPQQTFETNSRTASSESSLASTPRTVSSSSSAGVSPVRAPHAENAIPRQEAGVEALLGCTRASLAADVRNLRSGPYLRSFRRMTRSTCRPGVVFKALSVTRKSRICPKEPAKQAAVRNPQIRLLHALHARAVGATKLTTADAKLNMAKLTAASVEALAGVERKNFVPALSSGRSRARSPSRSTKRARGRVARRRSNFSKEGAISIASSCSADRRRAASPPRAGFAMSSLRGRARKRVSSESSGRSKIPPSDFDATPASGRVSARSRCGRPNLRMAATQSENPNLRGKTLKRVSSDSSSRAEKSSVASVTSSQGSERTSVPRNPTALGSSSEASPTAPRCRRPSDASQQSTSTSRRDDESANVRGKASRRISSGSSKSSASSSSPQRNPRSDSNVPSPKRSKKLPIWPVRLQTPKIYRAPFRSSEKDERNLRAERRRNAKARSSELLERTRIFGAPQDVLDIVVGYLSQSDKFVACMAHRLFHFTNEPRFHPIMDLTPVGASAAVSGRIRRPAEGSVHHLQLLSEFIATQKRFCEASGINIQKRTLFQLHDQLIPLFETHCPRATTLMIQDHQSRIITAPQSTISFLHRVLRGRQIKQVVIEDCVNHKFLILIDSSGGETCAAFLSHGGQCQKKKVSGGAFCPVHAKKQPFGSRA